MLSNKSNSYNFTGMNITVSGLIGVGKTTLSKQLAEKLSYTILEEPVEDNPYLDLFYKDMKKYAFAIQIFFLNYRFQQEQKNIWNKNNTIQDRSMWEDIIFARMLLDSGIMTEIDYNNYHKLFMNMTNFIKKPSLIIYLDVEPEIAFERIKIRNRDCEKEISLDYLRSLKKCYEEWLESVSKHTKVLRINWNEFMSTEYVVEQINNLN